MSELIKNNNLKTPVSPKKSKRRGKPQNLDRKIIFTVYFIFAVLYCIYCIWPLFWTFYNSLKPVSEYYEDTLALPKVWDFTYYLGIFKKFKVQSPKYISSLTPRVEYYMEDECKVVEENKSVWAAIAQMDTAHLRALPVVDKDGKYKALLHYSAFAQQILTILLEHQR